MLAGLAVLSFAVALLVSRVLVSRFGAFALDRPNERSLHQQPVPRTGGIAILAGSALATAFGIAPLWLPALLALGLAALSFFDDLHAIPAAARLVAHTAAASLMVWYTLSPMDIGSMVLLALGVAWMTNLYNFMDGADGVAGGMSVIGFGAYALAAHLGGEASLTVLCVGVAAASAGFLVLNFHPARIFLGDVGSIPLGFLSAALGVVGWRNDVWTLWFPLLVFGPFIGDATLTLLKRLLRGDRVWQPHRDHYYQRMVRMGFGHRRTACVGYALMIVCAGAALYGRAQPATIQATVVGAAIAVLAAAAVWVDMRWGRFLREPPLTS